MKRNKKGYANYKDGYNSRGLPSDLFSTPEPKHIAGAMALDKTFQAICQRATQRINELIEAGELPRNFWDKGGTHKRRFANKTGRSPAFEEVRPTVRQYRKYRNKSGLAYLYGRS